jgi:hypothetical protein
MGFLAYKTGHKRQNAFMATARIDLQGDTRQNVNTGGMQQQ